MDARQPEVPANTTDNNEVQRFQTDNSVSQKAQPKQQLSKSMEHMRFAVTVDPVPHSSTPPLPNTSNSSETAGNDAYGVPASFEPVRAPASRSHDPSNNQKRSDPFAFGSRYLEEGDNIFEFNAWDHVTVDASYAAFSEEQFEKQRADPVSAFDYKRFNDQPEKWWNQFYKNNKTNFFKNRKWLEQEFPILGEVGREDGPEATVLEVGAGAGNSAFPILQNSKNKRLKIHACDFSKKAVELIRGHELYNPELIQADVWDVAASPDSENGGLPPGLSEGSVDVVLMIFIFSALSPRQWDQAVRNVWRVLKPGGQVLFRDYGRGDLAQVRFKKGRYMEENFYVRGDGTRVYFFEQEELEEIWGGKKRDLSVGNVADNALAPDGTEPSDSPVEDSVTSDGITKSTTISIEPDTEDPSDPNITKTTTISIQEDDPNTDPSIQSRLEALALHAPTSAETSNYDILDPETPRPTFEVAHIGVDRRMLVNRQRRLKMYRCWMQAVFRKAGGESEVPTSTLRVEKSEKGVEGEEA